MGARRGGALRPSRRQGPGVLLARKGLCRPDVRAALPRGGSRVGQPSWRSPLRGPAASNPLAALKGPPLQGEGGMPWTRAEPRPSVPREQRDGEAAEEVRDLELAAEAGVAREDVPPGALRNPDPGIAPHAGKAEHQSRDDDRDRARPDEGDRVTRPRA